MMSIDQILTVILLCTFPKSSIVYLGNPYATFTPNPTCNVIQFLCEVDVKMRSELLWSDGLAVSVFQGVEAVKILTRV